MNEYIISKCSSKSCIPLTGEARFRSDWKIALFSRIEFFFNYFQNGNSLEGLKEERFPDRSRLYPIFETC